MKQIYSFNRQQQQEIKMAFLSRQNRTVPQQPAQSYAYGRHPVDQANMAKAEQKLNQQQLYKLQLQRQIQQKEQRKKKQQQKIRKQDEKFMREVEQINRKQNEKKMQEKDKLKKIEDYVQSPNPKKQQKGNQTKKPMIGNLNISLRQQQRSSLPMIPRISLQPITYQQLQSRNAQYISSVERGRSRPYLFQQNEQTNMYYEQRIRRHKQQMEMKLQELFHHINSTKDNIKVDEQIQKIKRRLRAKPPASVVNQIGMPGESRVELDYQNKFFNVPKKNNEIYKASPAKSRALDYQSRSKFTAYKNDKNDGYESRAKFRTQNDDMYSLPDTRDYQNVDNNKWGVKPGKDNYLSNRDALDYEAEKIMGKIDEFLNRNKE